jgi:hypothetical protein
MGLSLQLGQMAPALDRGVEQVVEVHQVSIGLVFSVELPLQLEPMPPESDLATYPDPATHRTLAT